jgi:hypothetical protein
MKLGVADTMHEESVAARVTTPGKTYAFANHDLGLRATLDLGIEAETRNGMAAYLALRYGESLEGTEIEDRGAELGVRWTW